MSDVSNTSRLSALRQRISKQNIDAFLASPKFIWLVMALAALSNAFSLELPVYTVLVGIAIYVCLRGADLLPLMPLIVACYIAPSTANNPGKQAQSIFSFAHGGMWLCILAVAFTAALIYRLIRDRKTVFTAKRLLLPGILILCCSYLLSGIGSEGYTDRVFSNLLFALMQCGCLLIPYWLLTGGVRWQKVSKEYFGWFGTALAATLAWEVLWIYCTQSVIQGGTIIRAQIHTGWGMYNNIGALLMIMLPFPFYLAKCRKKEWLGPIVGAAHVAVVLLTCSRNSILVAGALYLLCVIWNWTTAERRTYVKTLLCLLGAGLLACLLFWRPLLDAFSIIVDQGLNLSNRDTIFEEGLKIFTKWPIFGVSFFSNGYQPWEWSTVESFTGLVPPRWHNTYVQLLASGGLVAMLAYLFHRVQTAKLFLKQPSMEKTAVALSLSALCFSSIFDCHFFNMGPVLFYSAALAFAEYICKSQVPRLQKKNRV